MKPKEIIRKTDKAVRALSRVIPNLGSSTAGKRNILTQVAHSVLLHSLPTWAKDLNKHSYKHQKGSKINRKRKENLLCIPNHIYRSGASSSGNHINSFSDIGKHALAYGETKPEKNNKKVIDIRYLLLCYDDVICKGRITYVQRWKKRILCARKFSR